MWRLQKKEEATVGEQSAATMLELINVTPVDRSRKEGGRRSRNSCVSE